MIQNLAPKCSCSACVLTPESSHGIYMVGIYRPERVLTGVRGTIKCREDVFTAWADGRRSLTTRPLV